MAKLSDVFPSKFLRAADLNETEMVVTIESAEIEQVGQGANAERKIVLRFKENDKGLVLNKTNAGIIAELYGDETDDWEGKLVTLYPTEVQFEGKMVDSIRIRKKAPKPKAAPAKPAAPQKPPAMDDAEGDDDTPF